MDGEDRRPPEESLTALLAALAAARPAPGSGSAAAFAVAMAAALTRSVARLSGEQWEEAGGVIAQAAEIERRMTHLFEEDAQAYQDAVQTLVEREEIDPEHRDARLGETLERAAELPLQIGEAAADMAELAALSAEHSDHIVRADAIASALLAYGAARIAAVLVGVNLGTTGGDPRMQRADDLVARARQGRDRALKSDR